MTLTIVSFEITIPPPTFKYEILMIRPIPLKVEVIERAFLYSTQSGGKLSIAFNNNYYYLH
jgi:hypothetical protein